MLAESVYTVAQQLDKVQLDRLRAMLNADAAKEKQETKPKPKYKSPYMALYLDEQVLTEKVIAWFERQQKNHKAKWERQYTDSTYNNWGSRKIQDSPYILGYLNFKSILTIDGEKRHVRIAISLTRERKTELKNVEVGKKKVPHFARRP